VPVVRFWLRNIPLVRFWLPDVTKTGTGARRTPNAGRFAHKKFPAQKLHGVGTVGRGGLK
jgi:hypothetical protein